MTSRRSRVAFRLAWRLAVGIVLLLVVLLVARLVFFEGPYQAQAPLPAGRIVDIHCHTAGVGAGDSGCFISPALRNNFRFGIYLKSFGVTEDEVRKLGDALIIQRLSEQPAGSQHVGSAVILALDGVVNAGGELDRTRTEVYIPNEAAENPWDRDVALKQALGVPAGVFSAANPILARPRL